MILTEIYDSLFGYKAMQDEDIKKGNVLDIIDNITVNSKEATVKNYDMFITEADKGIFTDKQKKKVAGILRTIGIKKYNNPSEGVQEVKSFLMEVITALEALKPVVLDDLPDVIDVEVMSAREVGILGTISTYVSVILALEDFVLYLLYVADDEKFIYNLKNKEFIKDLSMIKSNYKELRFKCSDINKDLRKLDDELEVKDANSFNTHADSFNKKFNVGTSGFLGSPLFIMQKAWIDFRIDRIEAMKSKKALFELKINNLRNKNHDGKDLQIEKGIEYYEEKITTYERDIKAFEEDI